MQLNFDVTTNEQLRRSWAFAINREQRPTSRIRRSRKALNEYRNTSVITAASKEAKALGVQVGMKYEEAKTLVPGIKILVIGV